MAGNDQMSLPDIIALVVSRYPPDVKSQLLQSILLVSGGCKIAGLRERLISEITSRSEAGSKIDIAVAREPQLGCFFGMRGLAAKYPEYIKQHSIKRTEWLQGGLSVK
jgi:actin-related protein